MDNVITGQRISPELQERARALRREMTVAEQRLWQRLRMHRVGKLHFRRQQIVAGYIVDFYCDAARLAVEVDGPVHEDPRQRERDEDRDQILAAHGVRVIHITNEEVFSKLSDVLSRLSGLLQEAIVVGPASSTASTVPVPKNFKYPSD